MIDPDGDALTYSVLYSNDGAEWELLATGLTATSFSAPVDSLAGGANARFRVVANDGVNIGMDETNAPISVPDKLPEAIIANPADGAELAPGSPVVLQGLGSDLEDGHLPDEALAWSSEDPAYGGGGTPALPADEAWVLTAEAALLLAPGPLTAPRKSPLEKALDQAKRLRQDQD